MPRHEHFEKLCSLATLGEVSPEEMVELHEHLGRCAQCKTSLADFSSITNDRLPLAARAQFRPGPGVTPDGLRKLRESTLRRVADEGLHVSPEAIRGPNSRLPRFREWLDELNWSIRARMPRIAMSAALLAMVVIGFVLVRHDREQRQETERLQKDLRQTQTAEATIEQHLREAERLHSDSTPEFARLEKELFVGKQRTAQLEDEHRKDINAIQRLESRVAGLTSDKSVLAQHAGSADSELTKLRQDLEQMRTAASNKESQLVAQQYRISELSEQLESQKAAIDREQQLLAAGRDIRDLMTARNLHIIDVHDQDAHGESRPFGRIFLTEGKRLIFYAYDLDTVKVKNASFQAWGQRTEGGKATVNLGIFYVDDQKQSRWALKVEDPNLLKTIDSVFVTVEPSGGTKKPSGRKLMYAYLRNPINHP
jgi:uncharacterized membrane-anchored protein YhcB (DUF1043 family)